MKQVDCESHIGNNANEADIEDDRENGEAMIRELEFMLRLKDQEIERLGQKKVINLNQL